MEIFVVPSNTVCSDFRMTVCPYQYIKDGMKTIAFKEEFIRCHECLNCKGKSYFPAIKTLEEQLQHRDVRSLFVECMLEKFEEIKKLIGEPDEKTIQGSADKDEKGVQTNPDLLV